MEEKGKQKHKNHHKLIGSTLIKLRSSTIYTHWKKYFFYWCWTRFQYKNKVRTNERTSQQVSVWMRKTKRYGEWKNSATMWSAGIVELGERVICLCVFIVFYIIHNAIEWYKLVCVCAVCASALYLFILLLRSLPLSSLFMPRGEI